MKKVFKSFLKIKYNRLLSFIYKKIFAAYIATGPQCYSTQRQRRTTASAKPQKRTAPTGTKKKIEHQEKRKEKENKPKRKNKKQLKNKAPTF